MSTVIAKVWTTWHFLLCYDNACRKEVASRPSMYEALQSAFEHSSCLLCGCCYVLLCWYALHAIRCCVLLCSAIVAIGCHTSLYYAAMRCCTLLSLANRRHTPCHTSRHCNTLLCAAICCAAICSYTLLCAAIRRYTQLCVAMRCYMRYYMRCCMLLHAAVRC